MMALRGIACTFRVDSSPMVQTAADFRLSGPDAVLTMLRWVEKQMHKRSPPTSRNVSLNSAGQNDLKKTLGDLQNCFHSQMSFEDEKQKQKRILLARRSKILENIDTDHKSNIIQ